MTVLFSAYSQHFNFSINIGIVNSFMLFSDENAGLHSLIKHISSSTRFAEAFASLSLQLWSISSFDKISLSESLSAVFLIRSS